MGEKLTNDFIILQFISTYWAPLNYESYFVLCMHFFV